MSSFNITRQLNSKEQKLLNSHQEKVLIKIKRINKIIQSATACGGYVCGRYVRDVLVPLSKQHKVTLVSDVVSLRFETCERFMAFLCDKHVFISTIHQTPCNEIEYVVYIKGSRNDGIRYQVTISSDDLMVDVDIDQLTATINDDNVIVFHCSDDLLTVPTLIQNIIEKRVKFQSISCKEGILNNVLQNSIKKYINEGWTVDQSEMPENYQPPDNTD